MSYRGAVRCITRAHGTHTLSHARTHTHTHTHPHPPLISMMDVTAEQFAEVCERSRTSRDINQQVYEQITAMDDFLTFKKLMVKVCGGRRGSEFASACRRLWVWPVHARGRAIAHE